MTRLLDLDNRQWPIYTSNFDCPPVYTIGSDIENSRLCEGVKIYGSKVENSILGRSVKIDDGCLIKDSIIMDFTHIKKSCSIKRVVIDRFNTIPAGTKIGYDSQKDSKKYHLDSSGIVIVKRGSRDISYIGL